MPTALPRIATIAKVGLALVAASSLLGVAPARGQDAGPEATLAGFNGTAAASGLHALYAPQGLLPTGPPLDLGSPDALATIASGPATFARASVADPGDLLANPGALLALASSAYEAGTIPAYPYRVTAGSGVGEPKAESNPAPGLNAKVQAGDGTSVAEATMPALATPGIATIGSMRSRAATETDGSAVAVQARTSISDIDVAAGLLHIDSIVIDLLATTTGGDTTLEGGTTLSGATLAGQPVSIDEEGVRGSIGGVDADTLLEAAGLRVFVPGPVKLDGDDTGQLASTGLRIDLIGSAETIPGAGDILDGLPPLPELAPGAPTPADVVVAARAKHLVSLEVGRGVVNLTGRSATPFVAPPTPDLPETPPVEAPALSPLPAPEVVPATPTAPTPPAPAPLLVSDVPAGSVAAGIGALAGLVLLLQPFLGDRLARVAAAQLASGQEACPWER